MQPADGAATAASKINVRLLIPMLAASLLLQLVVPLLRIATSYKALEGALSPAAVGVLSGAFAIAPVVLAISIGRFNDRGGEGISTVVGSLVIVAASVGLWLTPPTFIGLLAFTCLLGAGQILLLSALQLVTTRCSGPDRHDTVLGYFTIAVSVGQILGPLVISLTTPPGDIYPGESLFAASTAISALMPIFGVALLIFLPRRDRSIVVEKLPLRQVMRTPSLMWIILASSLVVTSNDLLMVFFPVVGVETGIDAATVGWLLLTRSVASLASRFFFAWLAAAIGHVRLLVLSMIAGGIGTIALAISLPVWVLGIAMVFAGLGFGLALTSGISLTIRIAPAQSRSLALTLRIMVSRAGQFAIPLVAAGVALIAGLGAIFGVLGIALITSAGVVHARVNSSAGRSAT